MTNLIKKLKTHVCHSKFLHYKKNLCVGGVIVTFTLFFIGNQSHNMLIDDTRRYSRSKLCQVCKMFQEIRSNRIGEHCGTGMQGYNKMENFQILWLLWIRKVWSFGPTDQDIEIFSTLFHWPTRELIFFEHFYLW